MLFDSTLRRDLARSFGATFTVIVTIVLTMVLIRTLGQAALGRVSPQDVVLLLGYLGLGYLPLVLTLSMFIAIVSTLGRMYRDSEMTVWFASGVGLSRFVRPVLRTSLPVLVVVTALSLLVWPWANRQGAEMRDRFERRSDLSRVAPGQFQTSADGTRTFFIERDASDSRIGRNVFILSQAKDTESVVTARSGRIEMTGDQRYLRLEQGQRNEQNRLTGEKTLSRFDTYTIEAGDRVMATDDNLPPKARPTMELLRSPLAPYQGELAWRLGLVFGACNFLLLAIGLAATNPRRVNNWNLMFALLSFVIYYNIINLTQAWVAAGKVGMGAALLGAHGGAFALSLGLLWWRDHRRTVTRHWHQSPLPDIAVEPGPAA